MKLRGRTHKYLLKEVARDRVPAEVLDRPKQGFEVPLKRWFRTDLLPLAESLAEREAVRDWFRPESVQALVREHHSGLRDHSVALWTLLMFDRWADRHLEASAAAATGGGR
jgi:asparagine synthase (glutamine-hydrolysing)